jgi:hypothetical protein
MQRRYASHQAVTRGISGFSVMPAADLLAQSRESRRDFFNCANCPLKVAELLERIGGTVIAE